MLVKFSDGNFLISMDQDDAASLIEDYCSMMNSKGAYYPSVYELMRRMNSLYYAQNGCSICEAIEEYECLE